MRAVRCCCCCVQEEVLLSICMGLAICNLLASLRTDNAQDYVYLSYFLICEQRQPRICRLGFASRSFVGSKLAVQLVQNNTALQLG